MAYRRMKSYDGGNYSDPIGLVMVIGYTYAHLFGGKVGAILYNRLHLHW